MKKTLAAMAVAMLVLAGCSSQPSDDRTNPNVDGFKDTSKVIVWRNSNDAPNIVRFCADGLAWAATLSSDGAKQPQLLRVPERDSVCTN